MELLKEENRQMKQKFNVQENNEQEIEIELLKQEIEQLKQQLVAKQE